MNTQHFKQQLEDNLRALRPERKKLVMVEIIQIFQRALQNEGISLDIKLKVNEEFPLDWEDNINQLMHKRLK